MTFRIATRGSNLALWQARTTRALVEERFPDRDVELEIVQSSGDRDQSSALGSFGRTGIFTVEIDRVVLAEEAHVGVHSMKDMTTVLPDGLVLAGALARGPIEDVLVSRGGARLSELASGARVATGSRRRQAMLLAARPDLTVSELRGNVETRLAKIEAGEADATIMARAGLVRLGLDSNISEVLSIEQFVPAVAQGIVGLVCRQGDEATLEVLREVTDRDAWAAALTERAFLRRLEGGCSAPIGGHAHVAGDEIHLHGRVVAPDGSRQVEGDVRGSIDEAEQLGVSLAESLLARGAGDILELARA